MKVAKLYILFCLAFPFISFAQDDESWDMYMASYEKGPGTTLINMSLKQVAPAKGYPYLLKAGVKFTRCNSDGLPADGELYNLEKISEALGTFMKQRAKSMHAGTFTYQCEMNDYYYVPDTTGLREELYKELAGKFPGYEPLVTIKSDSKWEAYRTFLYPNEETQELMSNMKVLMKLREAGDRLDKKRQIDHWIYFATENDQKCFIDYCTNNLFKIESLSKLTEGTMRFKLQISRIDEIDIASISKLTFELKKQAAKCRGNYDGWETFVITE